MKCFQGGAIAIACVDVELAGKVFSQAGKARLSPQVPQKGGTVTGRVRFSCSDYSCSNFTIWEAAENNTPQKSYLHGLVTQTAAPPGLLPPPSCTLPSSDTAALFRVQLPFQSHLSATA